MARPRTFALPVGLDEMLRWALPKKRPEDRRRIFKEWSKANLAMKLWKRPTDEEAQAEYELWCNKKFSNMEHIIDTANFVKDFAPKFSANNRMERAQKAAKIRWSKKTKKSS